MRFLVVLMLLVSAAATAAPLLVPSTAPREAPGEITLEPLWSRGGEDDAEVLFGIPVDLAADAAGNVYVVDNQLAQIHAFDRDGAFLGAFGGEGEGPGEFQRPIGVVALPDGTIAGGSQMGGRFERLAADGTPRGTLHLGPDGPQSGFLVLYGADFRGGTFLVASATSAFDQAAGTMHRVQNLDTYGLDGALRGHVAAAEFEMDFTGARPLREKEILRQFLMVHAVGPDGRIYVPDTRDEYAVDVYTADGEQVLRISRPDFTAPPRNDRERARLEALVDSWRRNAGLDIQVELEDHEMVIQDLFVDDRGHLFVRHAASARDLPDGVFLRLDEFTPDGVWRREVLVRGVGDPLMDTLAWLGDGRAAVLRGGILVELEQWRDAAVYWEGEDEVVPELVVCGWR
jgi:hypothetical protein